MTSLIALGAVCCSWPSACPPSCWWPACKLHSLLMSSSSSSSLAMATMHGRCRLVLQQCQPADQSAEDRLI